MFKVLVILIVLTCCIYMVLAKFVFYNKLRDEEIDRIIDMIEREQKVK